MSDSCECVRFHMRAEQSGVGVPYQNNMSLLCFLIALFVSHMSPTLLVEVTAFNSGEGREGKKKKKR